jgi:hypothetical protein
MAGAVPALLPGLACGSFLSSPKVSDELETEISFHDRLRMVVGNEQFAERRRVTLAN